jgi:hypothetical protein
MRTLPDRPSMSRRKVWTDAYLLTDADADTLTEATGRYPSPADWRDEVFYSILIDRFDWAGSRHCDGDPADGNGRHGGNLAGVTKRLGYLQNLGVTTIVLSPVSETAAGAYHGYSPIKLDAVDPRLGSLADLVALTDEAHRRDMRIVLDLVLNHAGPVFEYDDGDGWKGVDNPGRIARWTAAVEPSYLASPAHFSRRGIIEDWKDPDQASWGDFPPNLRRLATENPATQPLLIEVARGRPRRTCSRRHHNRRCERRMLSGQDGRAHPPLRGCRTADSHGGLQRCRRCLRRQIPLRDVERPSDRGQRPVRHNRRRARLHGFA